MNLRHIEIFHAIYVSGSASAAARALNISQPSITKTLQHAEQILGFPLFLRQKNRLIPTDDAHALFGECVDIHSKIQSLRQSALNLRRGTGTLRISSLPSLALTVLPKAAARFLQHAPATFFDFQTMHHDEIGRRLYEHEADVVIAFDVPRGLPLTTRWIGEGELGLLYREEDLPDAPPRIDLATLVGRRFISVAQSGPIGDILTQELCAMRSI
jgi:DNA-binding transcriptional LysR family regulator